MLIRESPMIRNLPNLEYPLGALESGYRRQHLRQDIRQCILVGTIWLLPNFLFLYIDYLLYGNQPVFFALAGYRLFLTASIIATGLLLSRARTPEIYDRMVFIGVTVILGCVFMTNHDQASLQIHTMGLDFLIILSIYLMVPVRLANKIIPCVGFSLFNIFDHVLAAMPLAAPILTMMVLSFIMANLLGIWASSHFYSYRRQQYEAQVRAYELRKDLIQNALVDQLTGVSNRRHFFQLAEAEFERYKRYKRPFALLMIDLDHFKYVNDQFGHPVGDKILRDLADTINRCRRDTDTFGRLGGEEFALLLPETTLSGATDIAVRLRRACHGMVLPDSNSRRITISIGVTQSRSDDPNFDAVLARADATLYRAKNNGRDRVEVA